MRVPRPQLVFDSLAQAARSDRLLLFVGSGLSASYGLPTWRSLAEMLGNDNPDYRDIPAEFSKYEQRHGKVALHEFLERKLGLRPAVISDVTQILLQIRSLAIVTTNCDRILETAAHTVGAPAKVTVDDADLEDFHSTPWLRLVKLHGSLDQKDTLVFTEDEYREHLARCPAVRAKVADLMRFCTVLFLGYSLADPDFFALMQMVDAASPGNLPQMVGLFPKEEIESEWRKITLDDKVRSVAPLLEIELEDFAPSPEAAMLTFLHELKERVTPDALPALTKQSVIMLNGYTATLKSELANYLSNCLGTHLFATHRYGSCTTAGTLDDAKRHLRYQQMLEDAGRAIENGKSVILDGTFAESAWRKVVYDQAKKAGAQVIIVKTRCEDESYIRIRLWRRRLDHSRSDHEVTDISNFYKTRNAIAASPVEDDEDFVAVNGQTVLFHNHGDRSVQVSEDAGVDTRTVADLIRLSPLMSTHI